VIEQPQQVMVLPMDVAHDLYRRLHLNERRLPRTYYLSLAYESLELLAVHVHLCARLLVPRGEQLVDEGINV